MRERETEAGLELHPESVPELLEACRRAGAVSDLAAGHPRKVYAVPTTEAFGAMVQWIADIAHEVNPKRWPRL